MPRQAYMRGIAKRKPAWSISRSRSQPTASLRLAIILAMPAFAAFAALEPGLAQTMSSTPAEPPLVQATTPEKPAARYDERSEDEAPKPRNPFAPSRHSLELAGGGGGPSTQFHGNSSSSNLPRLRLRGLVQSEDGTLVTALLEVEKVGVYVVHKGDIIGLPNGGNDNVIKVNEITPLSILVEVGSLGQLVIVR